jgi:hypothetical protein
MRDDEWNELAAQWQAAPTAETAELVRTIRARIRRHRIGLYLEIATTGLVLGMLTTAALAEWLSASGLRAGEGAWYAGAALLMLLFQGGNLLLRRRHGMFETPEDGVLAWIDAERDRVRFVMSYWWCSALASLVVVAWAAVTVDVFAEPLLAKALSLLLLGGIGIAIARTVTLRRWVRRLEAQRAALAG